MYFIINEGYENSLSRTKKRHAGSGIATKEEMELGFGKFVKKGVRGLNMKFSYDNVL